MRQVLVVDDAVLIRSLLRDILRREGFAVHEAVGLRDALRRYREVRPDLVTMDLMLPDGSGLDGVALLREIDPGARIVVITAVTPTHAEPASIEAGAVGFVQKPFRPEDVVGVVRRCLAPIDLAFGAKDAR